MFDKKIDDLGPMTLFSHFTYVASQIILMPFMFLPLPFPGLPCPSCQGCYCRCLLKGSNTAIKTSLIAVSVAMCATCTISSACAAETPLREGTSTFESTGTSVSTNSRLTLTYDQQQTLLREATEAYTQGQQLIGSDSAEAQDAFNLAAVKYQQLIASGIRNSKLYFNLGNAQLQAGHLGRAIANYYRARTLDRSLEAARTNLEFALSRAESKLSDEQREQGAMTTLLTSRQRVRQFNDRLLSFVSMPFLTVGLICLSLVFWSLMIAKAVGVITHTWRFAALPLILILCTAASLWLAGTSRMTPDAIIVADQVALRAGDGPEFDTVASLEAADGMPIDVLDERAGWTKVKTQDEAEGWIDERVVEQLD